MLHKIVKKNEYSLIKFLLKLIISYEHIEKVTTNPPPPPTKKKIKRQKNPKNNQKKNTQKTKKKPVKMGLVLWNYK